MKPLTFDGTNIAGCYDVTINKRILNIKFNAGRFEIWSYCKKGKPSPDELVVVPNLTYEEAMRRAEAIIDCYRLMFPDHEVWGARERRAQ